MITTNHEYVLYDCATDVPQVVFYIKYINLIS